MSANPFVSCRRLLATLLIAVPTLFAAGGCEEEAPRAEFIFANRGEVNTLDPNRMSWMQDIRIGQALFEGVYSLDPETLEPVLGAGEKVDVSDDQLTYTITLKADAKWSNGDDVTSDDFIFAWGRMLREPGDYSSLLEDYIVGAKDYLAAYAADPKSADISTVGIERVDAKTFKVTLNNPTPYFPDLLAFAPYYPLNEKSLEKFKQTADNGAVTFDRSFTRPPNLIGNGAYMLTQWDLKEGQTLEMNPHYWGRDSVMSRTVRCLDMDEPNLIIRKYEAGEIDWYTDLPGDLAADLLNAGREDLKVFPAFGTYFWTFNCNDTLPDGTVNPFKDYRVRQAFAMSIEKESIVRDITKLNQPVTTKYVPPYFDGYPHPTGLAYDIAAARKLLAEAGYPDGKGFPSVTILYNNDTGDHAKIAPVIRRQWIEALGVPVELEAVESAQFKTRLNATDFTIARASWYGDYMDVSTFTDKYRSNSLNNDADWVNPEYDALLDAAMKETDKAKRLQLLADAEQILLDEAPIMPLYHYVNNYVIADHVSGIPQNPRAMISMQAVRTERSTGPGTAGK